MTTTEESLQALLKQVNEATKLLQSSPTVPDEVADLVDSFERHLHADAPTQLDADPYLATSLFAAAFRAEKALRHDNAEARRRGLRIALEQCRHALRDIVDSRPFGADAPIRDVLTRLVVMVSAPQAEVADLLGVSTRQFQRWLTPEGPTPAGDDEAKIRIVAQLANQLRHSFTGPGVLAWFKRKHPVLGVKPVSWLDDPIRYPALLRTATASRAMVG